MATSRSLNVVVTSETRAFKRGMDDAGRSLDKFGKDTEKASRKNSSAFAGMGRAAGSGFTAVAAAAGTAGVAVGAFAKVSVDAASDVQESISKNQVLFGKYAKDIEEFAKKSAAALGISRKAALEYTGVFGNLSRAIGISKKDSAAMSVQLTTLAADLASFNNTGIDEALDALRSGLTGETEPLRRFGVTLSAVSVEAEAVRSGIVKLSQDGTKVKASALQIEEAEKKAAAALKEHGKESIEYRKAANDVAAAQDRFAKASKGTVPELTAQEKALATVNQIMRQTKTAQGDAERTAGNYAGQVKRLQARLDDLKVALGERLIPVFERAVKWTNRLLGATDEADGKSRGLARGLVQAQKAAGEYAGEAQRGKDKTSAWETALEDTKKALKDYGGGINRVKEALDPYITAAKDVVSWTRRHKLAMEALDAIIITPIENLERLARALEAVSAAAKGIKGKFAGMFRPLINLGDDSKLFGDGLGQAADQIKAFGSSGSLMGARPSMAPVAGAGARFGLRVSSGLRPNARTSSGNQSYHSSGEALDLAGTPAGMKGFFNFMKNTIGSNLAELIYTPGGAGIYKGASHQYSGRVAAEHFDHVHVAVDTGVPGVGDGIGQIRDLWKRAGGRASAADMAAAIAMAESSGNPGASNRNSNGSIDRGLWQINSVHGALSTFDRMGNARAAVQISGNGRDWSPWVVYQTGAYKRFLGTGHGSTRSGSRGANKSREAARGDQTTYDPESMYAPSPLSPQAAARGRNAGIVYNDQGLPILSTSGRTGPSKGRYGPPKGLPAGYEPPEPPYVPTEYDWLDLALAKAEATPGAEDDVDALKAIRAAKQRELAAATDPREQARLIREVHQLNETIDGSNRIAEERLALDKQIASNQLKIIALTQQGPAIIAAVVAAVNGGIGGQLGLGFMTPGYAGGVANYAGGGTGRL